MAIEQDEIEKIAELARIRIEHEQIGDVTQRITESAEEAGATPVLGTLHATDAAVDVVLARVRSAREGYLAKVAANSF